MEIYKDLFVQIESDNASKILICNWYKHTEKATADDFKNWNNTLVQKAFEVKPNGLLANTTDYYFTITPDLQDWSVKNVFEQFAKAGIKKVAMLVSKEIISQLSIEQFADEYKEDKLKTAYFDTKESAIKWLKE